MQKIKEILKVFLPSPVYVFDREINRVIDTINNQNQNRELKQKEINNKLIILDNHAKEVATILEKQNTLLLNIYRNLKVIITDNESTVYDRLQALEKEFSAYILTQKEITQNQTVLEGKFNEEIKQRKIRFDDLNKKITDLFVNMKQYGNEQANKLTGLSEVVAQNQISLEGKFNEEIKQRKTGFDNLEQKIADLFVKIQRYGDTQEKKITTLEEEVKKQRELIKVLSDKLAYMSDGLNTDNIKNTGQLADIKNTSIVMGRDISEAVWAEVYNNTIVDSPWLKDKAFSPGRWAVGYPYLYVMYRILNEVQPQNILELGLGQSTKMIGQYTSCYKGVHHQVVEHDPEWIDFFKKNYSLSKRTKLIQLNREFVPYKEAEKVRVFKDFSQTFKGQKFDFISIDAPFGGDMKEYARIDVLQMIPACLAEDFIIMIDDCERSGEKHTVVEMERVLQENQILYKKGKYSGKKDCIVIASNALKFVCSM